MSCEKMMFCIRCKRPGHLIKDCFAYTDIYGKILPEQIEEIDSEYDEDSDYLGSESD